MCLHHPLVKKAQLILIICLIVCFFFREVLRLQLFKEEALDANDLLQSLNESIGAVSNSFNYDSLQTSLDQLHQPYTEEMYVSFYIIALKIIDILNSI